jgi:hypothetical protein
MVAVWEGHGEGGVVWGKYGGSGGGRESGEGAGTSRGRPRMEATKNRFSRAALRRGGSDAAPWCAPGRGGGSPGRGKFMATRSRKIIRVELSRFFFMWIMLFST